MGGYAGFFAHFGIEPDPRGERGMKQKLLDVLFIALCTVLSGGEGFTDMHLFAKSREEWLRKHIQLPGGIPSHDTFRGVPSITVSNERSPWVRWFRPKRMAMTCSHGLGRDLRPASERFRGEKVSGRLFQRILEHPLLAFDHRGAVGVLDAAGLLEVVHALPQAAPTAADRVVAAWN